MRRLPVMQLLLIILLLLPPNALANTQQNLKAKSRNAIPAGEICLLIDTQHRTLTVVNNNQPYKIFRVAVGKAATPTPIGNWKIIRKNTNWGSGFGSRFMLLDIPWGIYGIHGTNKPHSIGNRASHGCIRMFNRDVEQLYTWIEVGTPVVIVGNPYGQLNAPWRTLFKGHKGSDVVILQEQLLKWGFYQGKFDGIFGWSTEKGVKEFQKAHHLPITGQVDDDDYQKLGLK